jgi:glycosyltransferase involved in cell wall biosynthesis
MAASERRVRVLAVMASLMGGGAERQMVLILQNLDRSRFQPTLCLLEQRGELLEQVPADIPVIGLGKQSPLDVPKLVIRLAGILRRSSHDVVIAKVDYTNMLVSLAARLANVPVPLVLGEESVPSAAAREMSVPAVRHALLAWSYGRAACVTTPSPGVAADLRENFGVSDRALEVIPNMIDAWSIVDSARSAAAVPFADTASSLLVTAGRMQPAKGQADLLCALRLINQQRPCNLVVLGDGADRPRLEALSCELGMATRVSFPGFVANPFALMARADVFVSPSHFESFGNVIIEAMAVGVPVVSTRVPAGPEWLIADGETGVFARPRDPEDLAAKIMTLLDEPAKGRAMAERARAFSARYDVGKVMAHYEGLLEAIGTRQLSGVSPTSRAPNI